MIVMVFLCYVGWRDLRGHVWNSWPITPKCIELDNAPNKIKSQKRICKISSMIKFMHCVTIENLKWLFRTVHELLNKYLGISIKGLLHKINSYTSHRLFIDEIIALSNYLIMTKHDFSLNLITKSFKFNEYSTDLVYLILIQKSMIIGYDFAIYWPIYVTLQPPKRFIMSHNPSSIYGFRI